MAQGQLLEAGFAQGVDALSEEKVETNESFLQQAA